jgi:isocitrate dehydrogenase kinase/phosphatase
VTDLDHQKLHDDLIEELQRNIPQEWEASEGSAESIVVEYVREIERRLVALGGSLERWPEGTEEAQQ